MKDRHQFLSQSRFNGLWQYRMLAVIAVVLFLLTATPAMAHHAMGGRMPSNLLEGFMTGLAHPVIGFDHLAFIVSVGLFSAIHPRGIAITVAFVLSAMVGTGLHLAQVNLPGVELFVSGSVLLFGVLIVMKNRLNTATVAGLAAIAGIFHGYAYGESIFGAETTPLVAYLLGFTVIQLIVALSAMAIAKKFLHADSQSGANLRSAGLVISGVGLAFFSSQIINLIFPLPKG